MKYPPPLQQRTLTRESDNLHREIIAFVSPRLQFCAICEGLMSTQCARLCSKLNGFGLGLRLRVIETKGGRLGKAGKLIFMSSLCELRHEQESVKSEITYIHCFCFCWRGAATSIATLHTHNILAAREGSKILTW
jgi:hypothetical protein